ncbi:SMI1/KNR4 family protein [Paraflavitalea sp. CAU 1676]|uniref:SMI1/KNR4 family protein n=1 Tax=Paraflavitalea sp. CAU 1676 TaxID=3032598 RepID=UPI0023DCB2A0|nr:SMI1/KNR4 family protein [Paraflavitalea sp. CAU 1676]MDF2188612.1 SMI1/KNR4 family protein [Paraflavitalea sp. CAU 1676]
MIGIIFIIVVIVYAIWEYVSTPDIAPLKTLPGRPDPMVRTMEDFIRVVKFHELVKPCSEHDIIALEKSMDIRLPATYKKFLLSMGHKAGNFWVGTEGFYHFLFRAKVSTEELIEENSLSPLPDDAFPFWMHQGYMAAYFRLSDGDDPPVYLYSEGPVATEGFMLSHNTLTDFFLWELKLHYHQYGIILPEHLEKPLSQANQI